MLHYPHTVAALYDVQNFIYGVTSVLVLYGPLVKYMLSEIAVML